MKKMDAQYTSLLNGAVEGAQLSAEMGREFSIARRHLILAAYVADNPQSVANEFNNFDVSINNVKTLIQRNKFAP